MSESARNEIAVPLMDFNEAIAPFGHLFKKSSAMALVAFDGAQLHIEAPGFRTAMKAQGCWQGQVRVPVSLFCALVRAPLKADPVVIRATATHFSIHRSTVSCKWTETLQRPLDAPLFMPFRKALHLAATASDQDLMDNGLSSQVRDAVARRDKMIAAAAALLQELGVTEVDLHRLAAAKIDKEYSC